MKQIYVDPELTLVTFCSEDIMTASGEQEHDHDVNVGVGDLWNT